MFFSINSKDFKLKVYTITSHYNQYRYNEKCRYYFKAPGRTSIQRIRFRSTNTDQKSMQLSNFFEIFHILRSIVLYVMVAIFQRKQFSVEENKNLRYNLRRKASIQIVLHISSTLSTFLKDRESSLKQLQTLVFSPSWKRMRKA